MLRLGLSALCLIAVPSAQDEPTAPATLSTETFAAWRDHIVATPDERQWADLPWLMSFHEGLAAAAKANRPLLLWTMNGHPFGCT